MNPEETLIWKGSPSQWTNFGAFLFHLLLAAGVIAAYFLTQVGPLIMVGLIVLMLARPQGLFNFKLGKSKS